MRGEEKCVDIELVMEDGVHTDEIIVSVYADTCASKDFKFFGLQTVHQIPKYLRGQMTALDMGDDIDNMTRQVHGVGYRHTYASAVKNGKRVIVYRIIDVPEEVIKRFHDE